MSAVYVTYHSKEAGLASRDVNTYGVPENNGIASDSIHMGECIEAYHTIMAAILTVHESR
jgi:hypothetical protein